MDKEKKVYLVVKTFLENPEYTNEQLSQVTGISSSSVQRYLNDNIIKNLFDDETYDKIQYLISKNTLKGRRKGGINSFKNNEPIKDLNGKFLGVKKTNSNNKLDKKCNDTLIFTNIFLNNPNLSLQQIADFYNKYYPNNDKPITRDYVYDCLSEKKSYSWLADNLYEVVSEQLKERRITGNINGAIETNSKKNK